MIFFVYTQGMWERLFFLSPMIQYLVDGSIIAFILFQFKYHKNVPGSGLFFLLLVSSFLIGGANDDSLLEMFLYLRFIVYTYFIYNQLFYLNISQEQWGSIFRIIIGVTLLQGIGALYNLFILGERIEGYVGLMSSLGGTTATIFPLLISSMIFVFYLYSSRLTKSEVVLLLNVLFSVLLVGYSSGKRTIFFIIPFFFVFITIFSIPKIIDRTYLKRKFLYIALFSVLVFPIFIFGILNSKGLNYSLTGSESSFDIILNSLNYANEYETSLDEYGRTIGRSNTTQSILEKTSNELSLFLFGSGSNAEKDENIMLKLNYGYGIVGFTRDLISYGIFIAILTILLFFQLIIKNKSIKSNFTKTLRIVLFMIFLYTYFFYSVDFLVSLKITIILIIILAFINSSKHTDSIIYFMTKNKIIK
jgi:hypothetical protein